MTIFNVRIPGLRMPVVQADGLNVVPTEIDEFQIAVAETYDVIVTSGKERASTLVAAANDSPGTGRATPAPRPHRVPPLPPRRQPPRPPSAAKATGDRDRTGE